MREIPDLIPNFFYDLICRIVPGGFFLFTFWPEKVLKPDEPLLSAAGILFSAWAAGMILAQLSVACWNVIMSWLARKWPKWTFQEHIKIEQNRQVSVYELDAGRRTSIVRAVADVAFFRILMVIGGLTWLLILGIFILGKRQVWLSNGLPQAVEPSYLVAAIIAIPCCFCWCNKRKERNIEFNDAERYLNDKKISNRERMERDSRERS